MLQLGDSHTANDSFSGRMRELFQERFGAAGRGMLPPGVPFKRYMPGLVDVEATPGWKVVSSFKADAVGPFGIAGMRFQARGPRERITLTAREDEGFDRAAVEVLEQPGGGSVDISIDGGTPVRLSTGAKRERVLLVHPRVPRSSRSLVVQTRDRRPVELLSWMVERQRPGIVYENEGTIGATVEIVGRWDPATLRLELAERDPALILVAFGTNEGFHDAVEADDYRESFAAGLRAIRRAAPAAAILVMGPPDGNRLLNGVHGGTATCLAGPEGAVETEGGPVWAPPPKLALVRRVQREVAAAMGAYFWDWEAAMGGPCSMHRLVEHDPPLALGDHVHLRTPAYRATAEQLFQELMAGYDRYRTLTRMMPR